MNESQIEWTRWVWDFLRGCSRASPGCENCYAERYAYRFSGAGLSFEGLTRLSKKGEPRWTGEVRALARALRKPLAFERQAAREGVRSRVFVNSKSDTFHARAPRALQRDAYAVMEDCPHLDFLVLTKRPESMLAFEDERWAARARRRGQAPTNIWHGTSVENQEWFDKRAPLIAQSRAAIRFLSIEPLLERIDMRPVLAASGSGTWYERGSAIDWVIVGGESGARRRVRKTDIAALESIVAQCDEFGIPVFVKQLGTMQQWPDHVQFSSCKGGDFECWPQRLQRRELPLRKAA